jgi:hypothetical protein
VIANLLWVGGTGQSRRRERRERREPQTEGSPSRPRLRHKRLSIRICPPCLIWWCGSGGDDPPQCSSTVLRLGMPPLEMVERGVGYGRPADDRGAGSCLSCMNLHRRDKNADSSALMSQLDPLPARRLGESREHADRHDIWAAAMIVQTPVDPQPVPGDLSWSCRWPGQRSSAGVGFAIHCARAQSGT